MDCFYDILANNRPTMRSSLQATMMSCSRRLRDMRIDKSIRPSSITSARAWPRDSHTRMRSLVIGASMWCHLQVCMCASTTSPNSTSPNPVRRIQCNTETRNSFWCNEQDWMNATEGEESISLIASVIMWIVTWLLAPCRSSTISTARRQISSARRASPLTALTLRAA